MGPAFWTLVLAVLVNRLGTMVGPFLPLWLANVRGLDESSIALLVGSSSLAAMAAAPIGGWCADRFGRRPCLVLGIAANAAAMLAIPAAPTPLLLAAAAIARAFTNDFVRPATTAAVADVVPPELHRRAFGILRTAINLGFGIGTLMGGLIASRSFDLIFAIDAGTGLAAAGLIFLLVRETREAGTTAARPTASPAEPAAHPELGDRRRFALFCALGLLVSLMSSQLVTTLPLSLRRRGGADVEQLYGAILALNALVVVLGQIPLTRALETARVARVLASGALLYGIGYGLVGLSVAAAPLALAITLVTIGEILYYPMASVFTAEVAPVAERGRWFGALNAAFGAGAVISPLVGTWLLGRHGDGALWALSPPLGGLVALGLVVLGRSSRQR